MTFFGLKYKFGELGGTPPPRIPSSTLSGIASLSHKLLGNFLATFAICGNFLATCLLEQLLSFGGSLTKFLATCGNCKEL